MSTNGHPGASSGRFISESREGRYVGVHRLAALEFVARRVDHLPDRGAVRVRTSGTTARRRRGWWRRGVGVSGAGVGREDERHEEGQAAT